MTLSEWLREQLDADEANVRDWQLGVHRANCDQFADYGPDNNGVCDCGEPERRLAEVKAKRAILELHEGGHECSVRDGRGDIDNCHWVLDDGEDCTTVLLLAQAYADREGWQPEWSVVE